ncbi:MAG: efflux system, outer rane lipoprotein NodT family [Variovorax sp.]|nr:efflux system, outer rane lipoprotein NodT family [Variovorax sp.]
MRKPQPSNSQRRLFLSLMALAASGCAVGPDYVRPETPQSAALTREPLATAGRAPVTHEWWKAFGSPELDRLVEQALERSLTLAAAEASLRAARENVVAQRGFFFPTVQAGYNASRQNVGQNLSSPLTSGDALYTYHTAQLSVNFVPDVFGGNRRAVEALEATAEGQLEQLQAARVTLTSNLVAAALQDAVLGEQVAVTQQAIEVTQQQLSAIRKLRANGYSSGIDVATQENLLTQLQQTLPPLQRQREQTRDLIAVLSGHAPDAALPRVSLADIRMPTLPAAVPSDLVAQRPDVRAAETQVHAASAGVGVAVAARLPQLSLTASLGNGAMRLADLFSAGSSVWAVGAGLLQPVFAGGTLSARQRAAQAQLEATTAQYRNTVLAAFQNVADALYAIEIDSRALGVAEAGEAATNKTFELTRSQLRQGYATRPATLGTEQAWLQSKAARIAAHGTLIGDTVGLFQALGGGALARDPG